MAAAKDFGADYTLTIKPGQTPEELAKMVEETLGGLPDITIECSGAESSVKLAILVSSSDF